VTVAAIDVVGLTKRYGGRDVVRDVSFRVQPGEIVALLGPNGAGKTTTVETIEGYRRPDAGSVTVFGGDPARAGRDDRARVGLMLQGGGGIEPRLTAREVVALYARFHADPLDVDELLGRVGLDERTARTRYRRLSGGERQRVSLAVALVGRPELAILDEPTAGMDVEARASTRELLAGLRRDGVAILVTSHDLTDVERLADRIAIIDRGRLVAFGGADEIATGHAAALRFRLSGELSESDRTALAQALTDGLEGPAAARDGDEQPTVVADAAAGWERVLGIEPDPIVLARLAGWAERRGVLILELRAGTATLEERYLELVGNGDAAGSGAGTVA
jgi:ABC-2 type transport system ATP-binding protein